MRFLFCRFVFSFLLLVSVSCKNTNKSFETIIPDTDRVDIFMLDSALNEALNSFPDSVSGDSLWLELLYPANDIQLLWTFSDTAALKIDTLLSFVQNSAVHGVLPEEFFADSIQYWLNRFRAGKLSYAGIAKLELSASTAYIKYCRMLAFGFVDAKAVFPGNYIIRKGVDTVFIENCVLNQKSKLNHVLDSLQPTHIDYVALQNERAKLLSMQDVLFDSIPLLNNNRTIKLNENDSVIPLIIRRLLLSGELTSETAGDVNRTLFDENLLIALDKFRYKTGLLLDTEIGNNTIRALNVSFAAFIDHIDVNLERMRWKTEKPLGSKHIRVNVADMTLRAFRNDTMTLKMNVVVGKAPLNKTPLLQSSIYELVLNPTWTVPNSIIVKEISRLQARDTSYLRRHNMRVYYKSVEQNPDTIKWARITKKYQPYVIVQDSGSFNALGRVKFNFSNRFSVYLHDTNSRGAFYRHNRALSHGCVRVAMPYELAFFCLPEFDLKNKKLFEKRQELEDKIRYSTGLTIRTKAGKLALETDSASMRIDKLRVNPQVPLSIEYFTCLRNEKNEVVFRNDIYGFDKPILHKLRIRAVN